MRYPFRILFATPRHCRPIIKTELISLLLAAAQLPLTALAAERATAFDALAFRGSDCGVRPSWGDSDLPRATIVADPNERVRLHRDFPQDCAQGNPSCEGTAYLVHGDKVIVGETCDGWADIQFDSGGKKTWGWMQSDKLSREGEPGDGGEGIVVDCEASQRRMTVLRLGTVMGHITVPGEPSPREQEQALKNGSALSPGDTVDCRWPDGTTSRVRYGEAEGSVTAQGGACPATFLSLWHGGAQWLQAVKVGGFYGFFTGRSTDRIVVTPEGLKQCTVPSGDDCSSNYEVEGPDREVCKFTPAAKLPATIDLAEYPPPDKPRLKAGELALLQSRNDALCKAIVTYGSIDLAPDNGQAADAKRKSPPAGVTLIEASIEPPHPPGSKTPYRIDPGSRIAAVAWFHFDIDNSGSPAWVASRPEFDNFHNGDEYYVYDPKGLRGLEASGQDDAALDANAVFDIPFGWLPCAKGSGRAAAEGPDDRCLVDTDLPFDVTDYEGQQVRMSPRYVNIAPFAFGGRTYLMVTGNGGHEGDNIGLVLQPRRGAPPELSCAIEVVPQHF